MSDGFDADRAAAAKIRIVLIDDHPLIRRAIRHIVNNEPDLTVCGEAEDAPAALALVERDRPDLVLLDLSLGRGSSGLDLIKDLKERAPGLRVLVLSVHDEQVYAERALREGAKGYLNKNEPPEEIIAAIRAVLAGKIHLGPGISEHLLQRLSRQDLESGESEIDQLSNREREVFEMIGKGISSRDIAERLQLSMKTVDVYRQRIKEKLGLAGSTELARRAVEWVINPPRASKPVDPSPESPPRKA